MHKLPLLSVIACFMLLSSTGAALTADPPDLHNIDRRLAVPAARLAPVRSSLKPRCGCSVN